MSSTAKRLYELLDFVLDGSCTDDQRVEFARLVDEHPELIPGLARDVFLHSLLQWHSEDISDDLNALELAAGCGVPLPVTLVDPAEESSSHTSMLSGGRAPATEGQAAHSNGVLVTGSSGTTAPWTGISWARPAWGWAVAAVVMVAATVSLWNFALLGSSADLAVAKIIDQTNVQWVQGSTALDRDQRVVPGRLQTSGGSFTMKFRSGPTVRVTGAASMMIESDMLVHLDRGQATARVPDELKGFTIKTPVINVIDQGTEFGVATRDNGFTDVIVFDGKVDLQDSISKGNLPKRLSHGEAARVNRLGDLARIMQIGRDEWGGWWTTDYPSSDLHVIKEVRDNIPPSDGSKYFCYQITVRGLREDAPAYGDRHPHEWNGLTAEGLPRFLLGADYVRTFNDYRYINDFEMVVELVQPANLYIFFDNRVPIPQWLEDGFVNTGVEIGLDEGPWEGIPHHRTGVGGGVSIDNIFTVWHRRCERIEPVTLGPVGETDEARAMYGIAATPIGALGYAELAYYENQSMESEK